MRTLPHYFYRQSGVIPVRTGDDGIEILLVTTRRRGRWTIPKGVVDPGSTPLDSAMNEAYEEAGVRGEGRPASIGEYRYDKWGGECIVEVFILDVREILAQWPEARERRRRWMRTEVAAESIRNPELSALILSLASV